MSKDQPKRSYYPALDGLRGIGCFLIVVYHNFIFLQSYLFFTFLAMDIFFVLSGFLITDILLSTFGEKDYLKKFYLRRILRIFPLYYACLIFFLLILPSLIQMPVRIDYFVSNQVYFWFFLQNWVMIFHPSSDQSYLHHLWSMAIEEQFYLLWPLVVAFIKKPKTLLILLIVLLIGFSCFRIWLWFQHFEHLPYYSFFTLTRIDGICIGCMVALMQRINPRFLSVNVAYLVLAFAVFNFAFYFINLRHNDSIPYLALLGFSTFSMIFGLLVNDIVNRDTRIVQQIFKLKLLRFMGKVSYGTYIFHWPMYLIINPLFINWATRLGIGFPQLFSSIAITLLAYTAGYLSFRYFESPFLRLKKHFA